MKTRRIAAVAAGVVALSACQNPFPKVDPTKEALKPSSDKDRCEHVVAFSQQAGATDGSQTEMRLVGPDNPQGTSLALWTEEEAHIATNSTCAVNALGTNTGLQVVMAGGGVSKLAEGRMESVAVSLDGKDLYYVTFSDQNVINKRSLSSATNETGWFKLETPPVEWSTDAATKRPTAKASFWRMNDGMEADGTLHLVRHDVQLFTDDWSRISEVINHFSLDPSTKALTPIKAATGCNRWKLSPSGDFGICINYVAPGDVFVSATADIRDAQTGEVVMSLPADIAAYAVAPSLTKVDADVLRRPDLYWVTEDAKEHGHGKDKGKGKHHKDKDDEHDGDDDEDTEHEQDKGHGNGKNKKGKHDADEDGGADDLEGAILYVVNGRNTDDAKTPKPGAGIFTYDLETGERTQITDYPVSYWTMAP